MSAGETVYNVGAEMSPYYNYVIKSCAIGIMAPSITFGLTVQLLAVEIYANQCNPGDMFKVAGAWTRLAEKNWEAADNLRAEVDSVNEGNWSGDDAEAYKASANGLIGQLQELGMTAALIAAQLIAIGVALTAFWLFLAAATATMFSLWIWYVAVLFSPAGPVAAPPMFISIQTVAGSLLATSKALSAPILTMSAACAVLTGSLTVFTWGFQISAGNQADPLDIAASSITNMLEGFAMFWAGNAMMPGGQFASGMYAENVTQVFSNIAPTYSGEGNWLTDWDSFSAEPMQGGGPLFGVVDGLANTWEQHAPDWATNADAQENQWS